MNQNQDQNDNLFNFDSKPPQSSADEPTMLSGGAQAFETPPSIEPPEPQPIFTPPPAYSPPPAYTPPPGPPPQAPSKKNRTWLIVIIVLVLLCCCCLGIALSGYFWWGDPLMKSLGI